MTNPATGLPAGRSPIPQPACRQAGPKSSGLARWQLGLLHQVPAALGVDEPTRATVQRNLGGAASARDMTWPGFVRVMAYWESVGWVDDRNGGGHWTRLAAGLADHGEGDAMRKKIIKLAALLGMTGPDGKVSYKRLDGFCVRMKRAKLNDLEPVDLWRLIEIMKAMIADGTDLSRQGESA